MQEHKKTEIKKEVSTLFVCKKCGQHVWMWKTKTGKLVFECNKCGWAEVEG